MDSVLEDKLRFGVPWRVAARSRAFSKRRMLNRLNSILDSPYNLRPLPLDLEGVPPGALVDPVGAYDLHLATTLSSHEGHNVEAITKLFIDGRTMWKSSQMCCGLSSIWPLVKEHESWHNFTPFMCYKEIVVQKPGSTFEERRNCFQRIFSSPFVHKRLQKIQDDLAEVARDTSDGPSITVSTRLVFVLDWMALILLDKQVAQPKSTGSFQKLCPCCNFSTEDKLWWFLGNSPSRHWKRMAGRRPGPIQFIDIDAVMYDGMHGCARMHSIAWSAALMVADSRQRAFIISELKSSFNKTDPNFNIEAVKGYFSKSLHQNFLNELQRVSVGKVRLVDGIYVTGFRIIKALLE